MIRRATPFFAVVAILAASGPAARAATRLTAANPSVSVRSDALVRIPLSSLAPGDRAGPAWRVTIDGRAAPAQAVDEDGDGRPDVLVLTADFAPRRVRRLQVTVQASAQAVPSRVQAVLQVQPLGGQAGDFVLANHYAVPPSHKIHDPLISKEGPAWESDRVAYRLYLDPRNVIDVYGKKLPAPVMHRIGVGGPSYHLEADWGMDVLAVGDALGDGGLGVLRGDKAEQIGPTDAISADITANGPVLAAVKAYDRGWSFDGRKVDLEASYSIAAGSRLTMVEAKASAGVPIVAGLVEHPETTILRSRPNAAGWAYVATWGEHQSENRDGLGLALFYRPSEAAPGDDGRSLYVRFRDPQHIRYAFAAAWAKEGGGLKNQVEFQAWLDRTAAELAAPIRVGRRSSCAP
jgi:hypothetical protein